MVAKIEVPSGEIENLYRSGIPTHRIAKLLGIGRTTVARYLRKAGIIIVDKRHLTSEQKTQAKELYEKGMWPKDIGPQIGAKAQNVANFINKLGISRGKFGKLSAVEKDSAVKDYLDGKNSYEVADKYGVTPPSVASLLHRRGYSLRPNSIANRKYYVDHDYFENIDDEHKAYWLGFLAADDAITSREKCSDQTKLGLGAVDKGHLIKFRDDLRSDYPVHCYLHHGKYMICSLVITSQKMCDDLAKYTVTTRKTLTVRYPDIGLQFDRAFIRGLFDGDGCIGYYNKSAYFNISGNLDMITSAQDKIISYTGVTKTKLNNNVISKLNYSYQKNGNIQVLKILDWLYDGATIYLDRKYQKYQQIRSTCGVA